MILIRLFCAFLFIISSLFAETITNIQVRGNKRIETDTVLSYLPIKANENVDDYAINDALKKLFDTGYFADIEIIIKGKTLDVFVQENPIINQVAFEGNKKIKDEDLKKEVNLRPREVYSVPKVQAIQQRLLEIYRRLGRYSAHVEPKIIKLPENRVDLVFEIDEGDTTFIRSIRFVGNKAFSASDLRTQLDSKEDVWYRFFANDDTFDPERFVTDQQNLEKFYNDNGYPDFYLISAVSELTPDKKDFFLTFTFKEGEKYKFGTFTIDSKLSGVDIKSLNQDVDFKAGDTYSARRIDRTIKQMIITLGKQGFAFVDIRHDLVRKPGNIADINFTVNRGPRAFIEKIIIRGNDRTRDYVIRRELSIHEGDAYNSQLVKDSERMIKDLGFFKQVTVTTQGGSAHDKVNIIIEVEEQRTGEMGISVGYSSLSGPMTSFNIKEKNFRGAGQEVRGDVTVGKTSQSVSAGFTEPRFLDRQISASTNVFWTRSTRSKAYKESAYGSDFSLTYPLMRYWGQKVFYLIELERMSGVSPYASTVIQSQRGNAVKSEIGQTLFYNRLNRNIDTTNGYMLSMTNSYAGVGGAIKYFRNVWYATHYTPFGEEERVVLKNSGEFGMMFQSGGKVIRVADSFQMGGFDLRGFDFDGVGPRDVKTDSALGGTRFWKATSELKFPIGLPPEWGIFGSVFIEGGSLWKPGQRNDTTEGGNHLRLSTGASLMWRSPFGPISVSYGRVLKKKSFDNFKPVIINFSSVF